MSDFFFPSFFYILMTAKSTSQSEGEKEKEAIFKWPARAADGNRCWFFEREGQTTICRMSSRYYCVTVSIVWSYTYTFEFDTDRLVWSKELGRIL